jgi:hypothetical protein
VGGETEVHLRWAAGNNPAGTNAASAHHATALADPTLTNPCAFSHINALIYRPRVLPDTQESLLAQPSRLLDCTTIHKAMEGLP